MKGLQIVASCALVLAVALASPPVEANSGIEWYEPGQERPADMTRIMRKYESFTNKYGAAIVPPRALLRRFPGVSDPALTVQKILERFEGAKKKLMNTDVNGARADLTEALGWVRDNPATAAKISGLSLVLTRAYVMMAMIEDDARNKKAAFRWMLRLHNTIPNHPALGENYGDDAEKLYDAALKADARAAHGKLIVRVNNPGARIFIDGIERGTGGAFEGVFPVTEGKDDEYRIYVEVGANGYAFDSAVRGDRDEILEIDWDFQRSLVETADYVALIIPPELKAREQDFLSWVGKQVNRSSYSLISVRTSGDRRYLTGKVYFTKAGFRQTGEILLDDGKEDERMAAFAAFLENGTNSPLVSVSGGLAKRLPAAESRPAEFSSGPPLFIIGGGGFVVMGGVALAISQLHEPGCPKDQCVPIGLAMAGVGAVGIAVGVIWHLRESKPASRPPVTIAPTRGGVMAGMGWDF
jgi:hypothetical protein